MARYELPPGLSPEEERAVIAAIEAYLGTGKRPPDPWVLAARTENLRLGALQVRSRATGGWAAAARRRFAGRGTETRWGRGDSK